MEKNDRSTEVLSREGARASRQRARELHSWQEILSASTVLVGWTIVVAAVGVGVWALIHPELSFLRTKQVLVELCALAAAQLLFTSLMRPPQTPTSRISSLWHEGVVPEPTTGVQVVHVGGSEAAVGWMVEARERLEDEVARQRSRADIALYAAIAISALGLIILSFIVFEESSRITFERWTDALIHLVPRVSLIIGPEVGAIIAFRVFRDSVRETRYYSNELTNLEMRAAALNLISRPELLEKIGAFADGLASTERNIRLSKDETTPELEEARASAEAYAKLLAVLENVVKR